MARNVTIALCQADTVLGDKAANIAKGVKLVKEGKVGEGLTPSIRSPFQRTDFWAGQIPAEKPKGVW